MPYHALLYDFVDDFMTRRTPFREEHLHLARESYARGELILAGALTDTPAGALLVFNSADATAAENFARNDPYVQQGLVTAWRIRDWTVVIGDS